jgi:RNA polymerase sigma-70 factor (ECF subfamily)
VEADRKRLIPIKVARAQAGDRAALEWLLVEIQPELIGYLTRYLADRNAAEDAAQSTLMIVCRQLRWLRHPRFFRTWVYRIATREAWRHTRDRRTAALPDEPLALQEVPVEPDPEQRQQLLARIDELPPNCRAVVLLHYWSGLSLAAVAAALDLPPGTVKSRLAYALERLRKDHHEQRRET